MRKEINIREIARRCGVSPATVSRAISGKAPVREETRLKIEEAVRQAGYQTDQQRRKQQRGRVRAIGVFVPRLDHAFFQKVLDQLHTLLDRRGDYMVILPERGPETVEHIKRMNLDGVILLSEETSTATIRQLRRMHVSVVICGALSLSRLCPAVHVDDLGAAYDGTNYLINLGHRNIGFLCDSPRAISAGFQRITGCKKAMADRGLTPAEELFCTCDSSYAGGYQAAARLIQKHPELTAIFAHSDAAAIGAMAALMDAGYAVPEDVSVLGFDDTELGEEFRPKLTCVAQPIAEIVSRSLDLLYTGMEQPGWEAPPAITLPHSFTIRDSVRSPKKTENQG